MLSNGTFISRQQVVHGDNLMFVASLICSARVCFIGDIGHSYMSKSLWLPADSSLKQSACFHHFEDRMKTSNHELIWDRYVFDYCDVTI